MTFRRITTRARGLPLVWKLLLPFLVLLITTSTLAAFVLVRSYATRVQSELDGDLVQRALAVRSSLHERELNLLESANLAANLEGMSTATLRRDRVTVDRLLRSVLALKSDLTLVVITDETGNALGQHSRPAGGGPPAAEALADWSASPVVAPLLRPNGPSAAAAITGYGNRSLFLLGLPVCDGPTPCRPSGIAIVGLDVDFAASRAAAGSESSGESLRITVFDHAGVLAGTTAPAPPLPAGAARSERSIRRTSSIGGARLSTLFTPLAIQGERVGTLAVSVPHTSVADAVRGAALRLGFILVALMAGVLAIGFAVSKLVLAQVNQLVTTHRALEAGDLAARAPVLADDELGQVAAGLNQMADSLQESYELLETRVQERTAEVEQLLKERTEFFTMISHEFRTPLAIVLGQADLLARRTGNAANVHTAEILRGAAGHLLSFVSDIIDLADAESGGLHLTATRLSLATILHDLEPTITTLAKSNNLSATVKVPRRLPHVAGDAARLRDVVLNLVDNAVKYTPDGGSVSVEAGASNGHVSVSVKDTGVGIPADAQARIFEPFYRVDGSRPQRGQPSTGLGLAVVKRVVDAHGGDVGVTSEAGRGTAVTVTLPAI